MAISMTSCASTVHQSPLLDKVKKEIRIGMDVAQIKKVLEDNHVTFNYKKNGENVICTFKDAKTNITYKRIYYLTIKFKESKVSDIVVTFNDAYL